MRSGDLSSLTETRLLAELRHHFKGWLNKVTEDLSPSSFRAEVAKLEGDPLYRSFGLATPEYALIRLIGRVSISIGRRLGEIYDKLPRFIAQARFDLSAKDVAPKIGGLLQLDVCIPFRKLSTDDRVHAKAVAHRYIRKVPPGAGLAIEIRYNFNPNDSARLRKDVQLSNLLKAERLLGIYLVFSGISPRDEAIARLSRAGWHFLVADSASGFLRDLLGVDLGKILSSDTVSREIQAEMQGIMKAVYQSHAVVQTLIPYVTS